MVGNWSAAGRKAGKLCRSKGGTSSFTDERIGLELLLVHH